MRRIAGLHPAEVIFDSLGVVCALLCICGMVGIVRDECYTAAGLGVFAYFAANAAIEVVRCAFCDDVAPAHARRR